MITMAQLRKHFAVGNVIYSYYWRSYDRVIAFREDRGWEVTVRGCDQLGNILPGDDGRVRNHRTYPDFQRGDKVVATIAE